MTIRRRLAISFAGMLVIPTLIFMTVAGFARLAFAEQIDGYRGTLEEYRELGRSINSLVDDDPALLRERSRLDELSGRPGVSFSVWNSEQLITTSSDLEQAPLQWNQNGSRGPHAPGSRSVPPVVFEWTYPNGMGSRDTIRTHLSRPGSADIPAPFLLFFVLGTGVFIATNGFLSFFAARSILTPLRALGDAAQRIAHGDLSDPQLAHRSDEFGAVNDAFDEMRSRLKESLDAQHRYESNRRLMIASISHDLRTPMAAVRGYVEGIIDGVASTPEQRERYLATILERVAFADQLVERLTEFSKLDTGEARFVSERLNIGTFVRGTIENLAPDFPDIMILVAGEISEDQPIVGDRLQLTRAITNIVQNVAHHCPAGTNLHVTLEQLRSQLFLRFSDDGPGIPQELLATATQGFVMGDAARSSAGELSSVDSQPRRSGLGLTIASMITQAHGGRLDLSSREGKGTTVTIVLPVEDS